MNVLENLALNMIVTKEVEELINSQGKNQKTNEQMIAELKKEINERILAAEEGDDLNCELVSLVRQSTFQSQQTIQTNNEAMDINEDSHGHDLVSELIEKFEGD